MPAPTIPTGTHSHNATLAVWVSAAYTGFGKIKNIKRGPTKVKESDATSLGSASATKEFLPGLIDEGGFNATLVFLKADYATARGWLRVMQSFQIQAADGTNSTSGSTWTFSGFLTELGEDFPEDDLISVDVTFKISGPVTFAAGT